MKYRFLSLLVLPLLLVACSGRGGSSGPVSIMDVHGLAIDRGDSNRLYIATHGGLLVAENDTNLSLVGRTKADFMGFAPDPKDPNVLFASGHPSLGGNLGFQKSTDKGMTWKKIADGGPDGPVDFHTMTVSEANPDVILGWSRGNLNRSEDGGNTWTIIQGKAPPAISLGSDPYNDRIFYLGTEGGLFKSTDRGETWASVSPQLENDVVIDIEPDPKNGSLFLATAKQGIMRLSPGVEGGMTLTAVGALPGGAVPMQVALDRLNPQIMYVTSQTTVYKSADGGTSWQKIL